jgi:hypothetical protein
VLVITQLQTQAAVVAVAVIVHHQWHRVQAATAVQVLSSLLTLTHSTIYL